MKYINIISEEEIKRVIKTFYTLFPEDVAFRYSNIYLDALLIDDD